MNRPLRMAMAAGLTTLVLTGCGGCSGGSSGSSGSGGSVGSFSTNTDTHRDTEALWTDLLALDGMHWAYRARDTYTDGDVPASDGDPVLFFEAIGNNIPTISTLVWKSRYDYSVENVWYANLGPRPAYIDRGDGDEYVRFINGLATNFETDPGQLSPREARGEDFHFIHCFRTMPGASYEGSLTGGFSWKDRMGDGNQIGLSVSRHDFVLGPSGAVTEWGQDNIVEIRLFANGDAEFWLNGDRIIEHNFPSLVDTGLHEFILGTNSHVMSNHFRAAMFKRGSHFTEAELDVIYDNTHALWPRGQLPSFPYLEGAYPNRSTTWNRDTKTWEPPTGTFSGGNGEEGTHQYQWYYWDANDPTFSAGPLKSHLPIPGATQATLTRTDYEAGNTFGHGVIFDDLHNGHVRVMRVITPFDSSGTQGESLAGGWTYDNIP